MCHAVTILTQGARNAYHSSRPQPPKSPPRCIRRHTSSVGAVAQRLQPHFTRRWFRCRAAGPPGHRPVQSAPPARTPVPQLPVATPVSLHGQCVSMTVRRQSSRAMDAKAFRAVFADAPDAMVVADPQTGRVTLANRRAHAILGHTPQQLSRLSYAELFDEATGKRLAALCADLDPDACTRVSEAEIISSDGTATPADVTATIVTIGKKQFLQAIIRDDAERRCVEAELRQARYCLEAQNAEMRAAQAHLIETDRVRAEFLGMMSHELRTPVNILIGYAHMLLESVSAGDPLPASERAGILRRMVAGGHTLSELVEDTLSVLRLDAGAVRLDVETLALDTLFHELKGNDRLLRGPDAVEERWVVEPDVPEIATDRRKLRQVITNLVGNARKFTKSGHIEVRGVSVGPERVGISVTDTGCGISAEELPKVFDLYRQARSGQAHDGCGIGLYIVRRYVEMLQGHVSCTSTPGEGSRFTIEIPTHIQVPQDTQPGDADDTQATLAAAG